MNLPGVINEIELIDWRGLSLGRTDIVEHINAHVAIDLHRRFATAGEEEQLPGETTSRQSVESSALGWLPESKNLDHRIPFLRFRDLLLPGSEIDGRRTANNHARSEDSKTTKT